MGRTSGVPVWEGFLGYQYRKDFWSTSMGRTYGVPVWEGFVGSLEPLSIVVYLSNSVYSHHFFLTCIICSYFRIHVPHQNIDIFFREVFYCTLELVIKAIFVFLCSFICWCICLYNIEINAFVFGAEGSYDDSRALMFPIS